jgi:membrane protease YdiL (CAAX protease family)
VNQLPENRDLGQATPEFLSYVTTPFARFVTDSHNLRFRSNFMTYVSLTILLILYPALAVIGAGEDPLALLRNLDHSMLMFLLVSTIVIQWFIFGINYASIYLEETGLAGIGFRGFRLVHLAWVVAFLLASNLLLSGLAWVLGQLGYPMAGEVGLLIPTDPTGQVVWFFVALTAGICEEVAFRGYLMTRLRLLFKLNSWWIPTILSAVSFGNTE